MTKLRDGITSLHGIQVIYKHLLRPSVRTGHKYPNVDGNYGQDDTCQSNRGKFGDKLDPQEDPDKHYYEEDGPIDTVVVERYT